MASSPPQLIELKSVCYAYSSKAPVLKNINLTLRTGELLAVVGPNGSGKSTLLRILSNLLRPTEGAVSGLSDQTQLGIVFQDHALLPWSTVFDNVYLPLKLKGQKREKVKERILSMIRHVGLEGHDQEFPRTLSGGMKMRAAIARALITRPALLLMDEPMASLDELTRLKMEEDILKLHEDSPVTTVLVTHSLSQAVYLADRILILKAANVAPVIIDNKSGIETSENWRYCDQYNANLKMLGDMLMKDAQAG